jgi:hypothetical protein
MSNIGQVLKKLNQYQDPHLHIIRDSEQQLHIIRKFTSTKPPNDPGACYRCLYNRNDICQLSLKCAETMHAKQLRNNVPETYISIF